MSERMTVPQLPPHSPRSPTGLEEEFSHATARRSVVGTGSLVKLVGWDLDSQTPRPAINTRDGRTCHQCTRGDAPCCRWMNCRAQPPCPPPLGGWCRVRTSVGHQPQVAGRRQRERRTAASPPATPGNRLDGEGAHGPPVGSRRHLRRATRPRMTGNELGLRGTSRQPCAAGAGCGRRRGNRPFRGAPCGQSGL